MGMFLEGRCSVNDHHNRFLHSRLRDKLGNHTIPFPFVRAHVVAKLVQIIMIGVVNHSSIRIHGVDGGVPVVFTGNPPVAATLVQPDQAVLECR